MAKKRWFAIQKCFDSGRVKASVKEYSFLDNDELNLLISRGGRAETAGYDWYIDEFESQEDALGFIKNI